MGARGTDRLSVLEASRESRLAGLEATRDKLAAAMDEAPSTILPQIAGQLRATLAEIAELAPPEQKGDAVDEIAKRRTDRRASPAARSRSTKRSS